MLVNCLLPSLIFLRLLFSGHHEDQEKNFEADGSGSIEIEAVDSDDWWILCNLIVRGDSVMAVTGRKLSKDGRGGKNSKRVKFKVEIKVEVVDYDNESSVLRIRGKNELENEYVNL